MPATSTKQFRPEEFDTLRDGIALGEFDRSIGDAFNCGCDTDFIARAYGDRRLEPVVYSRLAVIRDAARAEKLAEAS